MILTLPFAQMHVLLKTIVLVFVNGSCVNITSVQIPRFVWSYVLYAVRKSYRVDLKDIPIDDILKSKYCLFTRGWFDLAIADNWLFNKGALTLLLHKLH